LTVEETMLLYIHSLPETFSASLRPETPRDYVTIQQLVRSQHQSRAWSMQRRDNRETRRMEKASSIVAGRYGPEA